ncbi:MAG TPA: alpha/beta fold hydrolase [Thermoanaerobaculia bacterium]|jgi:triacylglycerol lipase|nr:alpha/beta fold hydrolase [Thermoanaerobaculia bacterium]
MPNNRFPIALAHGIARFDILREILVKQSGVPEIEFGDTLHYFKGIKSHLERNGFEVHHTSVDFSGSVNRRAQQLSDQVKQILSGRSVDKVHIIAHSMGGLDARHMIVDIEGMEDKVASVTTIGTPHLGTSFADFGIKDGGALFIKGVESVIDLGGFKDLTTEACGAFNLRAKDREARNRVVYRTYASSERRDLVFLPLQPSWEIIKQHEGENDGLVSVKSQRWVSKLVAGNGPPKVVEQLAFPVAADHLNEVGWWDLQETNPILAFLKGRKLAEEFEGRIKQAYLEIARKLE